MTFDLLSKIISDNDIPKDVVLMSDSGWEYDATEINMIYYNSKTNTLVLTRKWANYKSYDRDDNWTLLYKEEK